MHLRKVLSAAAMGAFTLVSVMPGLAQQATKAVPQPPAAATLTKPSDLSQPQAQTPAGTVIPSPAAPFDPAVPRRMSVDDLKKHIDAKEKVYIIDSRYNPQGPIVKGAVLATTDQLEAWSKNIPKDALIVAYCT